MVAPIQTVASAHPALAREHRAHDVRVVLMTRLWRPCSPGSKSRSRPPCRRARPWLGRPRCLGRTRPRRKGCVRVHDRAVNQPPALEQSRRPVVRGSAHADERGPDASESPPAYPRPRTGCLRTRGARPASLIDAADHGVSRALQRVEDARRVTLPTTTARLRLAPARDRLDAFLRRHDHSSQGRSARAAAA